MCNHIVETCECYRNAFHLTKRTQQSGRAKMTTPEGKDRAKIEKKNSSLGRIWKQVSEFMDHSSIHGFKYITGSNRTIFEK